ncbi:YraN family protein [Nocardiopsis mwathae]|nr:YraN family protein [Nocardiopsis mwathae]
MAVDVGGWARHRRTLGRRGEELAAAYLERRGIRVLARNWRCREGEIDIVARCGRTLVVVEVKTRASVRFGSPLEAVGHTKRERLRTLARRWAADNTVPASRVRVDVIAVLVHTDGRTYIGHHRAVA